MKKLLFLLIIVLFTPILFLGFSTDANVYAYMGRLLVNGYVPYVDGWDHKGISLYFINAIGYLIGFKSHIGIRILELFLISYSFTKIFNRLTHLYSKLVAFIAIVIGLFTLKYFFDGGNMTEEYGVVFTLIGISLLLKDKIKTLDYAIIGALFVINLTIRANLISFWVTLFLVYCIQLVFGTKKWKEFLLSFLKMGYGALVVVIVYLIYFLSTDSLSAFIDAAFTFNFSYSESTLSSTFQAILTSVKRYHLSIIFFLGFIVSIIRLAKDKTRFVELLLILWVPIEIYFSNMSNRLYAHYFLMWIPLLILSVVVILSEAKERFKASNKVLIIGSAVLFVICFYVPSYMTLRDLQRVVTTEEMTDGGKVSNHIAENYKDAELLVWGNSSHLYNLNDKKSPTNFFYHSTFKYDTELIREKIDEFTQEVLEKKPTLIIDGKRNGMIQLDESNSDEIDLGQKGNLEEFLGVIKTYYVLKEQKYGVDFYVLKENE